MKYDDKYNHKNGEFHCKECGFKTEHENGFKVHYAHMHTPNPEAGRPTKMTEETINQLNTAFAYGCTDREACLYAGISRQTLYDYQEQNPDFVDQKKLMKRRPVLKARQTVVDKLDDPKHAKWYLEKKASGEFSQKQEVEHSGSVKQELQDDEQEKINNTLKGFAEVMESINNADNKAKN